MSQKVFENEKMAVHVDGNLVMIENKKSNVWGRVWVDGQHVFFTCRHATMELVTIRGDAVVSCYDDDYEEKPDD